MTEIFHSVLFLQSSQHYPVCSANRAKHIPVLGLCNHIFLNLNFSYSICPITYSITSFKSLLKSQYIRESHSWIPCTREQPPHLFPLPCFYCLYAPNNNLILYVYFSICPFVCLIPVVVMPHKRRNFASFGQCFIPST